MIEGKKMEEGRENINQEQELTRWSIDFNWFERSSRSCLPLVMVSLCPKCQKKTTKGEHPIDDFLSWVGNCCSKSPGYMKLNYPLLECVFRLFLANGNKPLTLGELSQQLGMWRSGDATRTSAQVLARLLDNDNYYGIKQTPST